MTRFFIVAMMAVSGLASGCKFMPSFDDVLPDKKQEYKKSESLPDLEVPSDLSSNAIKDTMAVPEVDSGAATYSTYEERTSKRKNGPGGETDANTSAFTPRSDVSQSRLVRGGIAAIWPKLQASWKQAGYELNIDDLAHGRMETAWKAAEQGGPRERYRLHAEEADKETTRLTLGRDSEAVSADSNKGTTGQDPQGNERLTEMLVQLEQATGGAPTSMVSDDERAAHLAEREQAGQPGSRTETKVAEIMFAGEGKKYLLVNSDFADAWKNTGAAFERAGIKVEDKDESRGVFYIDYVPKEQTNQGVFSRLAFWRGTPTEKHQVSVTAVGGKCELVVLDRKGNWENNATADRILESIQAQILH